MADAIDIAKAAGSALETAVALLPELGTLLGTLHSTGDLPPSIAAAVERIDPAISPAIAAARAKLDAMPETEPGA